jgi:Flp pilus assembly protein TadG
MREAVSKHRHGLVHGAERGDDSGYEFTVAVLPLVMMLVLIAFTSIVRASQMPAWSAASECARAAVATMNPTLGDTQARRAATNSLTANNINASGATITITGSWTPGGSVTCRVAYDIDVSVVLGLANVTNGKIPMVVSITLLVEPNKSSWQ